MIGHRTRVRENDDLEKSRHFGHVPTLIARKIWRSKDAQSNTGG